MTMQARAQVLLPAVGQTSTPNRESVAHNGTVLSLSEVAERMGWSLKTAYRKARAGQLDGAHKVVGATGETWAVPVATVAALQTILKTKREQGNKSDLVVNGLQLQVRELELELATVRAQSNERGLIVEQLQGAMRLLTVATDQINQVHDARAKTLQQTEAALQVALNRKWWQRIKPGKNV